MIPYLFKPYLSSVMKNRPMTFFVINFKIMKSMEVTKYVTC